MTIREFYTAVANANEITTDMIETAKAELAKMDAANAKRREKNAENAAQNEKYVEMLVGFLTAEPQTSSDLLAKFIDAGVTARGEGEKAKPITVQLIARFAKEAVEAGKCAKTEVKVDKKSRVAYVLA